MKTNYRIASPDDTDEILEYLKEDTVYGYDIETDSGNTELANIIGIGFTKELDNGWYLPLGEWDKERQEFLWYNDDYEDLAYIILKKLSKRKLVMQGGVFDVVVTDKDFGVDLTDAFHADTMYMKHCFDEEKPHDLEAIVNKYESDILLKGETTVRKKTDILHASIKANGGSIAQDNYELYKADMPIIAEYGVADTYLTLRLYYMFQEMLEESGRCEFFYEQEVMPLAKWGTIPMRYYGVPIDVPYLVALKKEVEDGILELEEQVYGEIQNDIEPLVRKIIEKSVQCTRTGDFGKAGLRHLNIPIPKRKDGNETVSVAALNKLLPKYDCPYLQWLLWRPATIIEEYETKDGEMKTRKKNDPDGPKEPPIDEDLVYDIKRSIFFEKNPASRVFNLRSPDHLRWLFFTKHKCKFDPTKVSKKTGKPSVDEEFLESDFVKDLDFAKTLLKIRKEQKILGTYIKGILERQIDGYIYPTMHQQGTTSGRYSCANPNFQNLPSGDTRIKKAIKAPPGYKIVNADFSSLEPRIFSWITRDPGLLKVWNEDRDLYSYLAIKVLAKVGGDKIGIVVPPEATDNPADDNFLKKLNKKARDGSKTFTLSVPYGSNAFAMHMKTGWPIDLCQKLIDTYLDEVPGLREYMTTQEQMAFTLGYVETRFGRIRHLPEAKELYEEFGDMILNKFKMALEFVDEDWRAEFMDDWDDIKAEIRETHNKGEKMKLYKERKELKEELYEEGIQGVRMYAKFRNMMNNAKNSPIQMSAAHVANAALIKYSKLLKENNIDGWICLQVHDELCSIIREDQAEKAAKLLEESMRNNWVTNQIDVPIFGEPLIADTLDEAK